MSAKRIVGWTLALLGLAGILAGSIVAGASAPEPTDTTPSDPAALAETAVGLGWSLALLGVLLSFTGIAISANARGAFF